MKSSTYTALSSSRAERGSDLYLAHMRVEIPSPDGESLGAWSARLQKNDQLEGCKACLWLRVTRTRSDNVFRADVPSSSTSVGTWSTTVSRG